MARSWGTWLSSGKPTRREPRGREAASASVSAFPRSARQRTSTAARRSATERRPLRRCCRFRAPGAGLSGAVGLFGFGLAVGGLIGARLQVARLFDRTDLPVQPHLVFEDGIGATCLFKAPI